MSTRKVSVNLSMGVDESSYRIVSVRIAEELATPTHARIEIATMEDIDFGDVIHGDATLEIHLDGLPSRLWSWKVASVKYLGVEAGAYRHEIELRPRFSFLVHTLSTRKFRNLSSKDVITKVLDEMGIKHSFWTVRTPPVRKYCMQYRESTFAFVSRLLEFEGMYYTFDHDDLLIFEDNSPAAAPVDGPTDQFDLLDAAGALDRDVLGIHAARRVARVASGKASVNDFNWKKPKLALLQSAAFAKDAELETYDYPAGYRKPGDGAYIAKIRLEAHRVASQAFEGRGNIVTFAPGKKFSFGGAAGEAFVGDYLIVGIEHVIEDGRFSSTTKQVTYENRFKAIPLSSAFRPKLSTPRPTVEGCHTAMVRGPAGSEIHTDKYGRFRAQFHWDREAVSTDEDSRWLRALQEPETSMVISRVGWENTVAYIDGDPDRPVGVARNINGVMTPTYNQPGNKNVMTIKTPSSPATGGFNEIKLDDSAGSMLFFVKAEKDHIGVVRNDRTERVGNDETHSVGVNFMHAVTNDQAVAIGANSLTTVGEFTQLEVRANRKKSVGGNEKIDAGNQIMASTQGNETETVGSTRVTITGSVSLPKVSPPKLPTLQDAASTLAKGESLKTLIPSPKSLLPGGGTLSGLVNDMLNGSIARQAVKRMSRTIGGAFISTSVGNFQTIAGTYAETVGGVKLMVAAEGEVRKTVTGPLKVLVGGAILRTSGEDMGTGAENTKVTVGATADFSAGKLFEVRGNVIEVEGLAGVKFVSGGLTIDMSPGSITMKGKMKMESSSGVKVTGSDDNITG
ncbi:MAG: type VI secretion system tip protein VgrG [Polyangiaceae bacterium]|nr:type VI secretion system tip protein VgrG [Polyangiaceae bacterium]